jgi:zinc protease
MKFPTSQKLLRYGAIALLAIALVIGLGRAPAQAIPARHYTELEFGPPPEIILPDYSRYELENGLVVYLVEDHELPLVSGSALFHTGDRLEPSDKVGLATITGSVMRSGGTTEHSTDELNQMLEQRAASVESSINTTAGGVSFNALSEDLEEVFGLFAEVIQRPAFPQDWIDLTKDQWRGAITRRNDDPGDITSREFRKLIYGQDSPYARTIEYSTLNNISRQDVVNFHRRYFHPGNMMLGIVGDFDPEQMRSLIAETFGSWQIPDDAVMPEDIDLPAVTQANQGGVYMVDQPQLTQSYVQFGHLGDTLENPDFPSMDVMNEVMNGLGGRLMNQVRSRQGLAYVVYAYWSPQFDYPGTFIGGGQTRTETTVPFIQAMLQEIETVRTTPVSEDELRRAKDSVLNGFIFNFQTPGQTISRLMRYEYYGYPADYIFQYRQGVEETTATDVLRCAQTYLQPENLVTLVVGNQAAIDPPLSLLSDDAQITQVDISIPQPTS